MKISARVRCIPSFEPALLPWPSSPCGGGQSWPDSLVFPQPAPVVLTGRPVKSSLPRATARFCTNQPLRGGPRNGTCPEKGEGFPARLQISASAQSSSLQLRFSSPWPLSGVPSSTVPLCSDPAVCYTAPAGPLGAGDQSPPRVVSWFGFLDVSLLFHSVSLSLTASGFIRRPCVKGFHGTELLAGPWLCDPSAVRDLREVAASGRSQQWSVPQWVLSVFCAQCTLVFLVAVSPYAPAMGVVAVDLGFSAVSLVLSAASLMAGAIASAPSLMVGVISSVFSSVYSVPFGYMCFDDWVYVASGYGLPSWYFGCWFSVTTLRQVVASCEWELTQRITDCPDHTWFRVWQSWCRSV